MAELLNETQSGGEGMDGVTCGLPTGAEVLCHSSVTPGPPARDCGAEGGSCAGTVPCQPGMSLVAPQRQLSHAW